IVHIDIMEPSSMIKEIKNVSCVIHTAGLVNDWSQYDSCYKINVTGTINVLKACIKNGIRNVIITGSNSSYGEEHSLMVKTEASEHNPRYNYFLENILPNRMNFYRISKSLCTKEAIKFAESHKLNMIIIEPVWVFGEREFSSGFYEYMKVMKYRLPFFPGTKKNKFHVIYAKDLARAYLLASQKMTTGIHNFIIGNKEAEAMERIYELICTEMGVKKPANLPKFMVYPIGLVMELFADIFKTKNPPLLSRSRINMFYDNISYSTEKAQNELNFIPEFSLEEGIKKTVDWYKVNKLI
ncbi:NAD-dependent epimerase/dehydratase family protein, partial [candidate division KSB1 bacterium]